jgi:5-methylcytosine-specific restriction endonuclease McrA
MDHVLPRSRGGKNAWENLDWAGKDVNARKGNRLPHEAGLKLLSVPRAPKELPATDANSLSKCNQICTRPREG